MLKPQDCMILLKLLANQNVHFSQRTLANMLKISLSEINAGVKRLLQAGLLKENFQPHSPAKGAFIFDPILGASEEFLIHGLNMCFLSVWRNIREVFQQV